MSIAACQNNSEDSPEQTLPASAPLSLSVPGQTATQPKVMRACTGDTRPLSVEFVAREADGRNIDEEEGGRRRTRSASPYRGRPRSRSPSYEPRRSPRRSPSPVRHATWNPPLLRILSCHDSVLRHPLDYTCCLRHAPGTGLVLS